MNLFRALEIFSVLSGLCLRPNFVFAIIVLMYFFPMMNFPFLCQDVRCCEVRLYGYSFFFFGNKKAVKTEQKTTMLVRSVLNICKKCFCWGCGYLNGGIEHCEP